MGRSGLVRNCFRAAGIDFSFEAEVGVGADDETGTSPASDSAGVGLLGVPASLVQLEDSGPEVSWGVPGVKGVAGVLVGTAVSWVGEGGLGSSVLDNILQSYLQDVL